MNKHLLLTGLLFTQLALFAAPAKRGYMLLKQPDGTFLSLQLRGDEYLHYYETPDGKIVMQDIDGFFKYATLQNGSLQTSNMVAHNPEERSLTESAFIQMLNQNKLQESASQQRSNIAKARRANMEKSAAFPSSGEVHGLVLLVEFSDVAFKTNSPLETFINHTNQENYTTNGATGSVRDYFISQSSGIFTPKFDVYGPITLPKTMSYYGKNVGGNDQHPAEMTRDACQLASSQFGVDFSKYDLDEDGIVDLVYVVYAGYGEAQGGEANTIWPHAWDIAGEGLSLRLNGKSIRKYACSSELSGNTGQNLDGIGTFCHEFSHCLGLPDLYNTSGQSQSFGMGEWDIMDAGSYNNASKTPSGYSAYEKSSVGWLTLQELTQPQDIELTNLHESNEAYVIYSDRNRNEYFIFENRQLSGWDTYLPADGLLITHIDYLKSAWDYNTVNNSPSHPRVSLVPADNELLLYNGYNYTQYRNSLYGDPYPGTKGNTSFTDTSIPAAKLYTGGMLGKPVIDIAYANGIITFSFLKEIIDIPLIQSASNIHANGFTANWQAISQADGYSLRISEVKGAELLLSEDFAKMTKGSINSPDASDISNLLDKYMTLPGWTGSKIYQAGGVCKLGSNSVPAGSLTSPQLELGEANGVITLYYTLQGKNNISKGAIFSLNADVAGTVNIEKITKDISSVSTRECVVFRNIPQYGYLKIQLSGVNFLDDLKIYTGNLSAQEPSAKTRAVELPLLIEGLTSTSYSIDGLNPETTYAYQVMAHKGESASKWSNLIYVKTDIANNLSNIENNTRVYTLGNRIVVEAAANIPVNVSQINGIVVFSGTTTDNNTSLTIDDCQKGVYIVQTGNKTVKVLITE